MHRWKLSALAAATFVSAALNTTDAWALSLGSLNVRSALGENLQAEIAIPQATAAEINSLVAQIASAETFRAQGMDYSNAARSIQVQLQRNADGTASLRLSSTTPIQEPFVDLVLETQWSTGRLVRSYTLLLDPPAAQRNAPAPVAPPQITAPANPSVAARDYNSSAAPRQRATAPTNTAAPASPSAPAASSEASTRVRAGDTAGRIANTHRPAGVSLDQMLVAMLRSNPDAFINGNVNRLRAGAVVQVPSRDQALETSKTEARQIVAAQSRDFNAYRRSLASKAPQATVQAADRSSGGQVQARVEETRPSAETPDKLTLSKGSVQNAAAEAKVAEQKQASDQDNRLNELQRNLAELNDLAQNSANTAPATAAASTQPDVPAAATPEATNAAAAAAPSLEVANATAAAASEANAPAAIEAGAAPSAETAQEASPPTPQADATPAKKPAPVAPAPTPAAEASVMDELLDNPLVPAGAGLVAVLLGLLGYTAWKRRRTAQTAQDPSLGDSQLQPDSFFGSSGGQQVDTSSADAGASTMAYSPSQLDGGGDVDPVAEADVYLAYGRDVQAEEILKEALRSQPGRLSIHVKLAEIYVKRHDIKALEGIARAMQDVSSSQDPEWQRVVEMGRHMDPTNPFFAAANTAAGTASSKPTSPFAAALNSVKPEHTGNAAVAAVATAATVAAAQPMPDIDLNLDLPDDGLSHTAAPAPITTPAPTASAAPTAPLPSDDDYASLERPSALDSQLDVSAAPEPQDPPTLIQDTLMAQDDSAHDLSGLDLDLSGFDVPPMAQPSSAPAAPSSVAEPAPAIDAGLDFDLSTSVTPEELPSPASPVVEPAAAPDTTEASDLDFDLGSLDLDLGDAAAPAAPAQPVHNLADDPLSTKLDLAQEFNAIGDSEGARALIEEVLAEASGSLKERAQKMLSELD
ncbi:MULTISPECIES: FimV/HubP family polar landmark protein [Comamonas]|uniref:FimV/HubP family polar landmark protein n=1 Tax=Comamonas TaxID=283 RepID=UPI00257B7631|nr:MULTISPECIES: FimV/HubP family polar landmark protein [Comamonas]